MDQTSDPVCPVCTLTVRRDILLEDHLNTHPKDQVIKALIGKCNSSANFPPPPPLTPAPATFQFVPPPTSSVIQYPYNFIPLVYNPFSVSTQTSFLPQTIFNAPNITTLSRSSVQSNSSVIAGLTITPSPSNVNTSSATNVTTSANVTSPREARETSPTSPKSYDNTNNGNVAITEVMEIQDEDRGLSEHVSIIPDKQDEDEEEEEEEEIDVSEGDYTLEKEGRRSNESTEETMEHHDEDGQVNEAIIRLEEANEEDYIIPDEYSPQPYSPFIICGKKEELEDDEALSEQFSPRDTVSMRDIQTDETMPAQGELSEQESLGGDTASLWGPAAEDVFSELASHGHEPSTHLLSDWPPITAQEVAEPTSSHDAPASSSSSCMTIEVLGSDNVMPMKVEVKTEQWIKVESEEVKQEQMEPEPLNLVPSLLQHRITDTNEKVLIGVLGGEESLLVQQSDVRRQQRCSTCDAFFPTLRDLQNHRRKEHRITKYTCSICNAEFPDRVELFVHAKSHPLECLQCGKTFNKRQGLTLHMKRHLGVKPHKCTICDKGFVTKQKLSEHFNTHTGRTPYKCKVCNKGFRRHSNLIQHKRWVHLKIRKAIVDLNCEHCDKIFHSKKRLAWHLEIHLKTPRICSFCPQRFVHRSSLTRHIRTMHDRKYVADEKDRQSVECPECFGIFCRTSLTHHLRTHTGERPHACNICFKAFSTKWNLQQHKWTHESPTNLPLKCTLCRKSYYRREDLEVHLRSHKNNRPFTCDFCGRKFSRKYNCIRHMREHISDKNYVCTICNKTFHRNYYLKEHMRVHTGHRPFACHICGKGSTTKSNHNKHVKTHHARESVTPEG